MADGRNRRFQDYSKDDILDEVSTGDEQQGELAASHARYVDWATITQSELVLTATRLIGKQQQLDAANDRIAELEAQLL